MLQQQQNVSSLSSSLADQRRLTPVLPHHQHQQQQQMSSLDPAVQRSLDQFHGAGAVRYLQMFLVRKQMAW